jgi:hypothetical protein
MQEPTKAVHDAERRVRVATEVEEAVEDAVLCAWGDYIFAASDAPSTQIPAPSQRRCW